MALLGYVSISFFFFFIFSAGIYNFLTDYEDNRCNMTYMYMYPQLIRISLPNDVATTYKKYGLYAYSEGKFIEKARAMVFKGIPVLFIPGNRGSPKQVRSLASVSLRKSLATRSPFHFDYFAIDLNEDYNALFGGFLDEQTTFVKLCMSRILSLYKDEYKPTSVVLIGHSIGGLIAKGLFLEPGFDPSIVKTIITLATPHSPVILPDQYLAQYYSKVNTYWNNNLHLKEKLNFVSIGGGSRDLLVRTSLTSTNHADFSVVTSMIPDVWLSVDHLCVLWCKELIVVIVRSLFDSVDLKTKQITDDIQLRKDIFDYHFFNRSGSKRFHSARYPVEVPLYNQYSTHHDWIPVVENQMIWSEKYVNKTTHLTVSLATAADTLSILSENHKNRDWIFACVVDTSIPKMRACKVGKNLSGQAKIAPTSRGKLKTTLLDLSELRMAGFTHVVVRILPSNDKVQVSLDLFKKRSRTYSGNLDYYLSSTLLQQTNKGALYYAIDMPGLQRIWQTYKLTVNSNCTYTNQAIINVNIPWNNEGLTYLMNESFGVVPIFLHSPNPGGKVNAKVELFLNPLCSFQVKLSKTFLPGLGAIISKQGISVFPYISACLLLTLAYQINAMKDDKDCPILHSVMPLAAKPFVIMQATTVTSAIGQYISHYLPFIPSVDAKNDTGMMELLVTPVALYLVAFCITYILGFGVIVGVIFHGQAYNIVILKFINKFCFGLAWLSEYVLNGAIKVPLVVSAFMMTVAYTACGGLAVCIGLGFYFFKMVTLYEDFWEEIVYWPLKALKAKIKQKRGQLVEMPKFEIPSIIGISFHLTLFMLWAQISLLNIPSVLVWAKNYRYTTKLDPDPGYICCIILTICAGILWQSEFPKTGLRGSKILSKLIFGSAVLIMTFAQTSLYRLTLIITANIALVTLHQMFAPFFTKEIEDDKDVPDLVPSSEGDELQFQLNETCQAFIDDSQNLSVAQKTQNNSEKDDEMTPSSEASSSSFEQIYEKDVS